MQQAGGDRWKASLETVAVRIESFEFDDRVYAVGRRLPDGQQVRVTMSQDGGVQSRVGLEQRSDRVLPGGVIVFHDCSRNPNGTYEARRSVVVSATPDEALRVMHDVQASVLAPVRREDGTWTQPAQIIDAARSRVVASYDEIVAGVLTSLSEDGPGRAGAVLRGIDPDGQAAAVMIHRAWDGEKGRYLSPEESFDAFVDRESVRIDGLENSYLSGAEFLGYVQTLEGVAWEVVPMRSVSYGPAASQAVSEGTRRDPSLAYRMMPGSTWTGFAPSLACIAEDRVIRDLVPLRGHVEPIMLAHIPTPHVTPEFAYDWRPAMPDLPRPSYLARAASAPQTASEDAAAPARPVETREAEQEAEKLPRRRRRRATAAAPDTPEVTPEAQAVADRPAPERHDSAASAEVAAEPAREEASADASAVAEVVAPEPAGSVGSEAEPLPVDLPGEDEVISLDTFASEVAALQEKEGEKPLPVIPLEDVVDDASVEAVGPSNASSDGSLSEENPADEMGLISLDDYAAEMAAFQARGEQDAAPANPSAEENISLDACTVDADPEPKAEAPSVPFEIDDDDLDFLATFEPGAAEEAPAFRGP